MGGHDTIYCDGQYWNGTVPTCLVPPSSPDLSVSVAGSPASHFKTGDVLDITCQAVGGNPVPDVMISLPGNQGGGEWRKLSSSVQFSVTEMDNDGDITCTAQNSGGAAHTERVLHILSK